MKSTEIRSCFFLEEEAIKLQNCICHSKRIIKCSNRFIYELLSKLSNLEIHTSYCFFINKAKNEEIVHYIRGIDTLAARWSSFSELSEGPVIPCGGRSS